MSISIILLDPLPYILSSLRTLYPPAQAVSVARSSVNSMVEGVGTVAGAVADGVGDGLVAVGGAAVAIASATGEGVGSLALGAGALAGSALTLMAEGVSNSGIICEVIFGILSVCWKIMFIPLEIVGQCLG
jgi:hypothetical protein